MEYLSIKMEKIHMIKMKTIAILLVFLNLMLSCKQHEKIDQSLIKEFNHNIIELPSAYPLKYSEVFIDGIIDWAPYEIIGIGEATHGTKEFFELKHSLLRFLVENYDFKILAYEFSFRTSLRINQYITQGVGNLDSLLKNELWIQNNQQVKDLLNWMRIYNQNKTEEDRVQFVGIDNQLDAFHPYKTVKIVENLIPEINSNRDSILIQIKKLEFNNYKHITWEEYDQRCFLFEEFKRKIISFKSYTINSKKINTAVHLADCLINSNNWLFNIYNSDFNTREIEMAKNVHWIIQEFNQKTIVWAQNSHINITNIKRSECNNSMGKYIDDRYRDKYFKINTAFTVGEFKAVIVDSTGKDTPPMNIQLREEAPFESSNYLFTQSKYLNFCINLNSIDSSSILYKYFNANRAMLGVGDCYAGEIMPHYSEERIYNILKATDLIFYFSDTKAINFN